MSDELKAKVQAQFGANPEGYATSDIHSKGESLGILLELTQPQPDWQVLRISAERRNQEIDVTVRDNGMGFPPEDSRLLFEKFYRVGDELRRNTAGTGLGLYIVQQFAALCGARVRAESDGPGHGAAVTVTWPEPHNHE
jgi:K+-sensing histidine kinase KdpD